MQEIDTIILFLLFEMATAVIGGAAAGVMFQELANVLREKTRSIAMKIINNTPFQMTDVRSFFEFGSFSTVPPHRIPANHQGVLGVANNAGGLAGAVGVVAYTVGGNTLAIYFTNPFSGSNYQHAKMFEGVIENAQFIYYQLKDHGIGDSQWQQSALGSYELRSMITRGNNADFELTCTHRPNESNNIYRYHAEQKDGWRFNFSTNPSLGLGWVYDGVAFRTPGQNEQGVRPVYQYSCDQTATYVGYRFLYSMSPSHADFGWKVDGVAFYAFPQQRHNTVAVYQHHVQQEDGFRHLLSTRHSAEGWNLEKVQFYAYSGDF